MSSFPGPIDTQGLLPLLDDLPKGFFTPEFTRVCEELDGFVGDCLVSLMNELQLFGFHGDLASLPFFPGTAHGRELLRWLVDCLTLYGFARKEEGLVVVECQRPIPDLEESFRRRVIRTPQAAPALAVQQLATVSFLPVLRQEISGEAALFSLNQLDLWFEYFANSNVYYAASNRLAALALARAVPLGAKILELGGGAGSAAQAALEALAAAGKPPSRYVFTEPQPAFLRRGVRLLRQWAPETCQMEARAFDVNLPPQAQGFAEDGFDAIYAVNVLHLAKDPASALATLRPLLKPFGVMVLGELLRPSPEDPVHIELPFLLLESYVSAGTGDGIRKRPGFLAWDQWEKALAQASFRHVVLLPKLLPQCRERYPGFYCAALTAQA